MLTLQTCLMEALTASEGAYADVGLKSAGANASADQNVELEQVMTFTVDCSPLISNWDFR